MIPFLLILLAILLFRFEFSEELIKVPEIIKERIEVLGVWAPLVFILLYIPVIIFFMPAWPLSLAGGMLFGMPFAPVYVVIGATLGGLTAFSISRYFEGGRLQGYIKKRSRKYYEYYRLIDRHGITAVIFLHFALLIPFAGINYLLGVTRISIKSFLVGTFIGLIPGSIFYTYFGFAIIEWSTIHLAVVSTILISLILLSLFLKKYLYKDGTVVDQFNEIYKRLNKNDKEH